MQPKHPAKTYPPRHSRPSWTIGGLRRGGATPGASLGFSPALPDPRRGPALPYCIGVPVDFLQASFHKSFDNTSANTLVPEPRRGVVFQDQDSANATSSAYGLIKLTKPIIEPAHPHSTEQILGHPEGVAGVESD